MADISEQTRTFQVYLDKRVAGVEPTEVMVEVLAGEDADEVCNEVLDDIIANECYSGWNEVEF